MKGKVIIPGQNLNGFLKSQLGEGNFGGSNKTNVEAAMSPFFTEDLNPTGRSPKP